MTRRVVVWGAVCLLAGRSAGAPAERDAFELGVKAGVNLGTLVGSTVKEPDPVTGPSCGVFASIWMGAVAIESDLLVTGKGYAVSVPFATPPLVRVTRLTYLELPVLVKAGLVREGPIRPYVGVGASVARLLAATAAWDPPAEPERANLHTTIRHWDVSAMLTVGISVWLGFATVSADARYAFSLADISLAEGTTARNSGTSVLAGISF